MMIMMMINTKVIRVEKQWWYYLKIAGGKDVLTFPLTISPKVNGIAGVEFELAQHNITVYNVTHYDTGTF